MRLFQGKILEFKNLINENKLDEILSNAYYNYYGIRPTPSERRSWIHSLNSIKNVFEIAELNENWLIVEQELPYSSRRIDVIIFGEDKTDFKNTIIVELKQWSNENVFESETEQNLIVNYGSHIEEVPHPQIQVEQYYFYLKDFLIIFNEDPRMKLEACVYCHNYSRNENVKLKEITNNFPIFYKEDARKLGEYLKERLSKSDGFEVFNRFINSPIKPSKKLLDHTYEMINKRQIFTLIDDQIVAYNSIMKEVKKIAKLNEKHVFIIKGGPGTGKSVIALELMGELLRKGLTVFHATGSSAFTNTLRDILGNRARNLFKFFYSFTNCKENQIDVLICDEAHRIRANSSDFRVPRQFRSTKPQIDDLIKPAKISIFFIDELQRVRPNEIGSVNLIRQASYKLGIKEENIHEYELKTQFRCSGSDVYLQWLDNILELRKTEYQYLRAKELRMEFEIVDNPVTLKQIIDEKNKKKKNCARIVAGFCWPWSDPLPDGSLVKDVKIGEFEMPWENKNKFWEWATKDVGAEQVGTVYTSQGFEFDYIGVIFGNDLVYNKAKQTWEARPENSYDTLVKRNNPNLLRHLKSVYRVLLSRAHFGVYIYFMDKDTEDYFRSRIIYD